MTDLVSVRDWHNKKLYLSGNSNLIDLCCLTEMELLDVKLCHGIKMLYSISHIQDFKLTSCQLLSELFGISDVKNLTVDNCSGLTSIKDISNVDKLWLWTLTNLVEVLDIKNVREVELHSISNIADLTSLGSPEAKVQLLTLDYLPLLTSNGINHLGRIPEVHLHECSLIGSITALSSCNVLSIINCRNVKNVSGLGSVSTLTLDYSRVYQQAPFQLEGIDALGKVKNLTLARVNVRNEDLVALATVQTLKMIKCGPFTDISPLSKVETLSLIHCIALRDAKVLVGKVKKLIFERSLNLYDVNYEDEDDIIDDSIEVL
jgi:hypothetical protein